MKYGRITFDVALTDDADPEHVIEHNLHLLRHQCFIAAVDGASWDGASAGAPPVAEAPSNAPSMFYQEGRGRKMRDPYIVAKHGPEWIVPR